MLRKGFEEPTLSPDLLVVLMAAAVCTWWYGRVRVGRVGRLAGLPVSWIRSATAEGELRVAQTLQASRGVRLMVVEWAGGRRVLVATNGANTPVTLDVAPAADQPAGEAP